MSWADKFAAVSEGRPLGACPVCGKDCLEAGFQIVLKEEKMGYGAIWCNACRTAYHVSRMKISEKLPIKNIPKDFRYI